MSCPGIVAKFRLSKIRFTGDKFHLKFQRNLFRFASHTFLIINSSHSLQICFSLASNSLQIYFKRMRFKFVSNSLHVPLFNIKFASNLVIIVYSSGLFKDQTRTPLITAFKISVLFMLFLHCAKKSNF